MKRKPALRWSAEYRCRRCGLKEADTNGEQRFEIHRFFLDYHKRYWTREERAKDIAEINKVIGGADKRDAAYYGSVPEEFTLHICADEGRGLGEFIGFIDPVLMRYSRGEWKAIDDKAALAGGES